MINESPRSPVAGQAAPAAPAPSSKAGAAASLVDVLINLADAAKQLGISVRTFRRMVARGEIPVVRLSSKILRYRQSDIAAIVAGDFSRQLVVNRWPRVDQRGNTRPDEDQEKQSLGRVRPRLTT